MKIPATNQKLRGGYYTPKPIAEFISNWAIQSKGTTVLEPSCGDGALLESIIKVLLCKGAQKSSIEGLLRAVEVDGSEAQKASARVNELINNSSKFKVNNTDFFEYCRGLLAQGELIDAVIGNPPFVRYQNFPEEQRFPAFQIMVSAGLRPTRLTNSWMPFLIASTLLLKTGGRLAMIIPAELLQVNYASELRGFLSQHFSKLTLVTFRKLVFEGIQQEIVLLLGERGDVNKAKIQIVELDSADELSKFEEKLSANKHFEELDHSTEKWTLYFLNHDEITFLREVQSHPSLNCTGDVIDVNVGIVTGLNDFFVLKQDQVESLSLKPYTRRLVGRSAQLAGIVFSDIDWSKACNEQTPAFLLNAPDLPAKHLPLVLKNYVEFGEANGMHTGYKCRIRDPWYVLSSTWNPDAFMLRQVHTYPKIVLNNAGATCTDTIHRVRLKNGISAERIAVAFVNSLTFAFSEVIGRSYGGGVLELEPNEAEKLPLPLVNSSKLDIRELDNLLRSGKIELALDITDKILLRDGLNLSDNQTKLLRGIWHKMRNRRIERKFVK